MRHRSPFRHPVHLLAQALREDRLSCSDLSWLHPYQPSLSCSWLFQRSMSVGVGQLAGVDRGVSSLEDGKQLHTERATGSGLASDCNQSACDDDQSADKAANGSHAIPPPRPPQADALPSQQSSPGAHPPPWWHLRLPPSHVNDVLAANFAVMRMLGDRILRPFLQVRTK